MRRSFSTALLSRERTIVINLEHVKARGAGRACIPHTPRRVTSIGPALGAQMIVTAEEALIPNAELAEAAAFADMLSSRLRGVEGSAASAPSSKGGSAASLAHTRPRSAEDLVRLAEQSATPAFAPPPLAPPHHFHPHHSNTAGAAAAVHARVAAALSHVLPPPPPPPPPPSSSASSAATSLVRPPASVVKPWLCISATGVHRTLLLDQHAVAQRCGVPLRDLRVLDIGLTTRRVRTGARMKEAQRCSGLTRAPQLFDGAAVPQAHHCDQPGACQGAMQHRPSNR